MTDYAAQSAAAPALFDRIIGLGITAAGGKSIHGPYGESIVCKGADLARAVALIRVKQYARYETILRALRNTVGAA